MKNLTCVSQQRPIGKNMTDGTYQSDVAMVPCNQPKAFTSVLSDDQSRYLCGNSLLIQRIWLYGPHMERHYHLLSCIIFSCVCILLLVGTMWCERMMRARADAARSFPTLCLISYNMLDVLCCKVLFTNPSHRKLLTPHRSDQLHRLWPFLGFLNRFLF